MNTITRGIALKRFETLLKGLNYMILIQNNKRHMLIQAELRIQYITQNALFNKYYVKWLLNIIVTFNIFIGKNQ